MRYFAILKDSLREALDTKIFYFTLGLSLLVILLVGSVSFRPVSAEERFQQFARDMNRVLERWPNAPGLRYHIVDVQKTNDAAEPWNGNYRFFVVLEIPDEKLSAEIKDQLSPRQLRDQLGQAFPWVEKLEVSSAPSPAPTEIRFLVETTGTKVKDRRGWVHEPRLFFGAVPIAVLSSPLNDQIEFIAAFLIGNWGAGLTMLLSTIITAFFIPNMLRKGTIDLLLAKPIHRTTLLIYKFLGGLTFMFLNTLVIMAGLWLVLGLRTGVWINGLLLCVFIFTFQFAIFYAVSTLLGVCTRSPIVAILGGVLLWPLLWGVGMGYRVIDALRPEKLGMDPGEQVKALPGWLYATADVVHFVTPHYKDLDLLTTRLIRGYLIDPDSAQGKALDQQIVTVHWDETIIVTVIFIVVLLGMSCWWFATCDY